MVNKLSEATTEEIDVEVWVLKLLQDREINLAVVFAANHYTERVREIDFWKTLEIGERGAVVGGRGEGKAVRWLGRRGVTERGGRTTVVVQ